ncbi:MAG: TRAP transporter small permease [Pseudomonadota bacterium]|nr:TRAP transporter small permease [Pseudomonadota bacterium]
MGPTRSAAPAASSAPADAPAREAARAAGRSPLLAAHDRLIRACGALAALGFLAAPVLVSADVISRHAAGANIAWLPDVCEYLLFAATMLGAPWLLRLGRHVRIDILPGLLPGRAARGLEQGINLFLLAVSGALVWQGVSALDLALRYGSMLYKSLTVPVWPFVALFILSFSVIALELAVRLVTGRVGGEDDQPHL